MVDAQVISISPTAGISWTSDKLGCHFKDQMFILLYILLINWHYFINMKEAWPLFWPWSYVLKHWRGEYLL